LAVGVGQENQGRGVVHVLGGSAAGADRNRKSAVVPRQWRGGRYR
jgi:hypothetical protein